VTWFLTVDCSVLPLQLRRWMEWKQWNSLEITADVLHCCRNWNRVPNINSATDFFPLTSNVLLRRRHALFGGVGLTEHRLKAVYVRPSLMQLDIYCKQRGGGGMYRIEWVGWLAGSSCESRWFYQASASATVRWQLSNEVVAANPHAVH